MKAPSKELVHVPRPTPEMPSRIQDVFLIRYARRTIGGQKVLLAEYHWFLKFDNALQFAGMSVRDGEYCEIYQPWRVRPVVVLG